MHAWTWSVLQALASSETIGDQRINHIDVHSGELSWLLETKGPLLSLRFSLSWQLTTHIVNQTLKSRSRFMFMRPDKQAAYYALHEACSHGCFVVLGHLEYIQIQPLCSLLLVRDVVALLTRWRGWTAYSTHGRCAPRHHCKQAAQYPSRITCLQWKVNVSYRNWRQELSKLIYKI